MKILLSSILLSTSLFAYTDCSFRDKKNEPICKALVKKGVSIKFANEFVLSKKNEIFDSKTLELFHPDRLKYHEKQETKANKEMSKYINNIVKHLDKYKLVYDLAEKKYKVNREIIAGILMKETRLGTYPLKHDSFTTLNTLYRLLEPNSKRNKRLIKMGERNLVALGKRCYKFKIPADKCSFPSSYAGAIGFAQFMPENFIYVKGYNSSYGDLNKMEDAILSIGNYMNKRGKIKKLINLNQNLSLLKKKYVKYIKRYNYSDNYAFGVLELAKGAYEKNN